MPAYTPAAVEPKWQRYWVTNKTFRTPDPAPGDTKPKYYALDMFPYPSGSGLHVGHPEGYTATDILARYRRMNGFHVLHPMGWDAFGLPAEQHAIATGEHPRINTANNIATFRRQIQALGFSYDWDREVDTTEPAYVKWTQWIFLLLFDTWYDADLQKGRPISELPVPADVTAKGDAAVRAYQDGFRLAYQAEQPVNWCAGLGTVLSNEEVIDGKSERGNFPVTRLPLRQWLMRITAYAERLIDDLEPLDWSESIKQMQRNWIGRSEGAIVSFTVESPGTAVPGPSVRVFTTRPDTLFGATYMVLAPEHELVEKITTPDQSAAVKAYQTSAASKSDFDRVNDKKKSGVFTGAHAINPVNGERIPIWIADYVLAGYGTGAIMAVPAHDGRDYEFAVQFGLPIVHVVQPADGAPVPANEAFTDEGVAVNSGFLNGLTTEPAKAKMIAWLEEHNHGTKQVNYKLRDWLFSRQRYWGEPFPILHELGPDGKPTGAIEPLDVSELPLLLPEVKEYKPTGSPDGPLAKATDWLTVTKNGKTYRRETNTMPQWAGSCWYYLRYTDPLNESAFADPAKLKHWLPVDLYVGGAEHAVLHLLYARFWHKVLFDRGYIHCPEPFFKLVNQGMILGEMEYNVSPQVHADNFAKLGDLKIVGVPILDSASIVQNPQPHVKSAEMASAIVLRMYEEDGRIGDNLPDAMIEKRQGKTYLKGTTIELHAKADKMSKSRGNVVNPDDVIREYGADSLRLFEMFLGPLEATKPWNMRGVEGVYRFLSAVWRAVIDDRSETVQLNPALTDVEPTKEQLRELHKCIKKVTDDTAGMRFNTAISAMMEFKNFLVRQKEQPKKLYAPFVLILAPYAPHMAEELWAALGNAETLAYAPWPKYDPALLVEDEIEVPVSVNGKMKAVIRVPVGLDAAALEAAAKADAKIEAALAGKTIKKVIAVPGKMVNLVV